MTATSSMTICTNFKKMKREEVIMARRTEMQFFKKMGVICQGAARKCETPWLQGHYHQVARYEQRG